MPTSALTIKANTYIGHKGVALNSIGHYYMGHNYIGHNTIGQDRPRRDPRRAHRQDRRERAAARPDVRDRPRARQGHRHARGKGQGVAGTVIDCYRLL